MEGKTLQKPYSNNQIESVKPNAPRSENILTGYIASSMNGGINKTIAYKKIMAGERHKEYRIQAKFQMLTPLTPTYQNLKCTLRAYFVPNSRVWNNAEEYTAQRGGASVDKITEIPNFGGKTIPILPIEQESASTGTLLTSTEIWRDSFMAPYFPSRLFSAESGLNNVDQHESGPLPKISALPVRGRIAIYNDFERNKEYEPERIEYKTDQVTDMEWSSYLPYHDDSANWDFYTMRARRQNNYYTDYRTELQGLDLQYPNMNPGAELTDWVKWENLIAESRSQTENAQKNDWDIISEIRGSKKLTEGKVQLIGQKTFNLNYAAITQNAYSSDGEIDNRFRVLGKQGAYSYTEINESIYAGMVFNEEGYVHIIATVSADTVFETGIDRNLLNVTPLDEYRPDLIDQKEDVLYKCETDTVYGVLGDTDLARMEVIGFKRKFSEYFKLPNIIGGDMSNYVTYQNHRNEGTWGVEKAIACHNATIGNDTFQFFEQGMFSENIRGKIMRKKPWLDYTDFQINKNQAIENEVELYRDIMDERSTSGRILGQNQVFFVGICNLIADLPINEEIKHNYTTWGEH